MPMNPLERGVSLSTAAGLLLLINLACRPVITIGWGELLLVGLLAAVILGPLLLTIARRIGGSRDRTGSKDED